MLKMLEDPDQILFPRSGYRCLSLKPASASTRSRFKIDVPDAWSFEHGIGKDADGMHTRWRWLRMRVSLETRQPVNTYLGLLGHSDVRDISRDIFVWFGGYGHFCSFDNKQVLCAVFMVRNVSPARSTRSP